MARTERAEIEWEPMVADVATRARYEANVYRRGPGKCAYWLGAISDSGHGKLRAAASSGTTRMVTAHVLGYAIVHGPEAVADVDVIRHRCDSPSCQLPEHWIEGTRRDNAIDYASRSRITGHALADLRGAAGRARAIRDAIRSALTDGKDVETAIEAAIRTGQPGGAEQAALW
jgi:hypothetical protein